MMPIYNTTRLYTAAARVHDTTHITVGELLRDIIYILSSLTAQGYIVYMGYTVLYRWPLRTLSMPANIYKELYSTSQPRKRENPISRMKASPTQIYIERRVNQLLWVHAAAAASNKTRGNRNKRGSSSSQQQSNFL
jgi:hypothetical protein